MSGLSRSRDFAKYASLIGYLGQALFPCIFWIIVTHPGHTSLRSLVDAMMATLQAYVGSEVESPAIWRALICAVNFFGFFHEPRPVRDDPIRIVGRRFTSCHTSHLILTEFSAIYPHTMH